MASAHLGQPTSTNVWVWFSFSGAFKCKKKKIYFSIKYVFWYLGQQVSSIWQIVCIEFHVPYGSCSLKATWLREGVGLYCHESEIRKSVTAGCLPKPKVSLSCAPFWRREEGKLMDSRCNLALSAGANSLSGMTRSRWWDTVLIMMPSVYGASLPFVWKNFTTPEA